MKGLDSFDVAVVGAGVIGLAIAQQLSAAPFMRGRSLVLLEQESGFGQHTSSRNSEVIHAGIYYPSGSLKALLCVRGKELLYEHCRRYDIPHKRVGKLIVGGQGEAEALERLLTQAASNGVSDLQLLEGKSIQELEAQVSGTLGLYSPSSGIINSHSYLTSLLHLAQSQGVVYSPRTQVQALFSRGNESLVETRIMTATGNVAEAYVFRAGVVICCAGLEGAALASRIEGLNSGSIPRQYLCKGDYFSYAGRNPFRHLVYPLPESNTTGLGIHATLDMAGQLRFGPDTEYIDQVNYSIDPLKRERFAEAIRRYFPAVNATALNPDYAGIRPKLAGPGQPPADFVFQDAAGHGVPNLLQLFGIESPGLTASLAIGEKVTAIVRDYF